MHLIGKITDLQRGALWGEYAEAFLLGECFAQQLLLPVHPDTIIAAGTYTCLIVVTLWKGLRTGRPLNIIGWFIVVVYWLTVCRAGKSLYDHSTPAIHRHSVALGFCAVYRVMLVNGGNPAEYTTTDYVLLGIRQ